MERRDRSGQFEAVAKLLQERRHVAVALSDLPLQFVEALAAVAGGGLAAAEVLEREVVVLGVPEQTKGYVARSGEERVLAPGHRELGFQATEETPDDALRVLLGDGLTEVGAELFALVDHLVEGLAALLGDEGHLVDSVVVVRLQVDHDAGRAPFARRPHGVPPLLEHVRPRAGFVAQVQRLDSQEVVEVASVAGGVTFAVGWRADEAVHRHPRPGVDLQGVAHELEFGLQRVVVGHRAGVVAPRQRNRDAGIGGVVQHAKGGCVRLPQWLRVERDQFQVAPLAGLQAAEVLALRVDDLAGLVQQVERRVVLTGRQCLGRKDELLLLGGERLGKAALFIASPVGHPTPKARALDRTLDVKGDPERLPAGEDSGRDRAGRERRRRTLGEPHVVDVEVHLVAVFVPGFRHVEGDAGDPGPVDRQRERHRHLLPTVRLDAGDRVPLRLLAVGRREPDPQHAFLQELRFRLRVEPEVGVVVPRPVARGVELPRHHRPALRVLLVGSRRPVHPDQERERLLALMHELGAGSHGRVLLFQVGLRVALQPGGGGLEVVELGELQHGLRGGSRPRGNSTEDRCERQ